MRVLIEMLHILLGLAVALALTLAAGWAYAPARVVIWWCGTAAMVATVALGIGPLRRAIRDDRASL